MTAADCPELAPTSQRDPCLESSPRPHSSSGVNGWKCSCGLDVLHGEECAA